MDYLPGRRSFRRVREQMVPHRVRQPARSIALWGAVSPNRWNIMATRAAPVVCPVRRAVASIPLALPARCGGAELSSR